MSDRSRSRSRSPLRWDYKRSGHSRTRQSSVSSSRSTRWAPWHPGETERQERDATGSAYADKLDQSGRINPYYPSITAKADIVPEFDPEKSELPALQWLNKIEQLGAIHGWNDSVKSYYMQSRLSGLAKMWHGALRSYEFTWMQWKQKILEAFPQNVDYAEALKEMLGRRKLSNETMTHYFYSKSTLLTKCDIVGEKAVSCIIEGLPFHLKTSARAGNYRTPGEVFSQFLCMNDDKRVIPTHIQRGPVWRHRDPVEAIGPAREYSNRDTKDKKSLTCFLCNEPGHVVRFCPKNPKIVKCDICSKTNHKTEQCYQKAVNLVEVPQVNECYFKDVCVNGTAVTAYLDTGAQVNLMTHDCALRLGLTLHPCDIFVKGFNGLPNKARGKTSVKIVLDELCVVSDVIVTDVPLNRADIFIGQPIINNKLYTFTVAGTTVTLEVAKTDDPNITSITDVSETEKIEIFCSKETVIPPLSSMHVEVYSGIQLPVSTVLFVDSRSCSYNDIDYTIPSSVYNFPVKSLPIINNGSCPLFIRKDKLLARAFVSIESDNNISKSTLANDGKSCDVMKIDVAKINCGSKDPHVQQELLRVLQFYSDCFSTNTAELGTTNKIEMKIELNSDKPICYRPYRLSFAEKAIVREKVDDLLSNGIIRESSSNYASPVVLVRKKNNDFRLCIDFRKLNSITVKDKYPLPIIEEQVEKLGGKKFFTSLDLSQSFYQIPVAEDSIHKTGFVTPEGHYEFLRMPFGLSNSPAVFQRLMDKIFSSLRHDKVLPYIDDLLLPTATESEGLDLLKVTLDIIRDAGVTLNLDKCFFLQTQIDYLGYEISENGIRPGNKKMEAVAKYERPQNQHELRMFLGLTSYFRKFVRDYADISYELYKLLKKDIVWEWGPAQQQAFISLKEILTQRPLLSLFRREGKIEVHTDASSRGLAGILLQQQEGSFKPIAYFSRKASREESMYHSYELEALAVVESIKRFRIYLFGQHFKVITDCAAVRYTFLKKDLTPRIARWWLSIQEYDMEIEHRPGKSHSHVDALSRFPVEPAPAVDINVVDIFDWVICLQNQDEKLQIIKGKLESGIDREICKDYKVIEGRLYRIIKDGEDRLVVPKFGRWNILRKYHDLLGHPGLKRCEQIIKGAFWFAGMTRFIRKYVNACLDCLYKRSQYGRPEGELHPIEKVPEPMHTLHVDHLGPFCKSRNGNCYLLMAVDSFTKFIWALPVKTTKSHEVIKSLESVFCLFGFPKRIISDSGSSFKSNSFKQFCLDNQVKHIINAVACPRANGQVERYNRTLLDSLNTSVENEREWDIPIPNITWGMNNLNNSSTGFTPYRLMFSASRSRYQGMGNNTFDSESTAEMTKNKASANLHKTAGNMSRYFNAKHKVPTKHKVNELVLWKGAADRNLNVRRKLKEKYSGPYKITKVVGNDRYMITSLKGVKGYKRFNALVSSDSVKRFQGNDSESSSDDSQVDSTEELIDLLEG